MITDVSTVSALMDVWQSSFGDDRETVSLFFETAYHPSRTRYLREGGEIVASLYWFDCLAHGRPIAYLYAIATDSKHRGKGYCKALMRETHEHLAASGYAGAILVPAEPSLFDFYAKLGYRTCSYVNCFTCIGAKEKVRVSAVSKDAYAAKRRQLLPEGSVIQENENLDYLAAQYGLYKSSNALFAARREGDALYVTELLGDPALAPGLVSALGAEAGHFRTPGAETPFAMYLALDGTPPPTYFGLAFD